MKSHFVLPSKIRIIIVDRVDYYLRAIREIEEKMIQDKGDHINIIIS